MLERRKIYPHCLQAALMAFLLVISTPPVGAFAEVLTKQQQWDQQATEVATWTDGLGLPLDAGIYDTVIVLNLLGLTTRQSCEGHMNWGQASPWVDFRINEPEAELLQAQGQQIFTDELSDQLLGLRKKYPKLTIDELYETSEGQYLKPAREKMIELSSLYVDIARKTMQPLVDLLDQFYQVHNSDEDQRLYIYFGWIIRLESQGSDVQLRRTEEQKATYLKLYQEEMKTFTDFLKAKFYQTQ